MSGRGRGANDWIYLKLYLGSQIEKADAFIISLASTIAASDAVERWFYLRFIDEDGFHIRLRVLPTKDRHDDAAAMLTSEVAPLLDTLHLMVPSSYSPMVSLPDYLEASEPPKGQRVKLVQEPYEPEQDKYGTGISMDVCEDLFCASSVLAARILTDEDRGLYSRKSMAPWLMYETNRALPSFDDAKFWRDYSLYWLGGESLAAQDWRTRFARKAADLRAMDEDVLDKLPAEGAAIIGEWRDALANAASRLASLLAGARPANDVLSVNVAHLFNNRLGLAMLEEAYLATLLENRAEVPA